MIQYSNMEKCTTVAEPKKLKTLFEGSEALRSVI